MTTFGPFGWIWNFTKPSVERIYLKAWEAFKVFQSDFLCTMHIQGPCILWALSREQECNWQRRFLAFHAGWHKVEASKIVKNPASPHHPNHRSYAFILDGDFSSCSLVLRIILMSWFGLIREIARNLKETQHILTRSFSRDKTKPFLQFLHFWPLPTMSCCCGQKRCESNMVAVW